MRLRPSESAARQPAAAEAGGSLPWCALASRPLPCTHDNSREQQSLFHVLRTTLRTGLSADTWLVLTLSARLTRYTPRGMTRVAAMTVPQVSRS